MSIVVRALAVAALLGMPLLTASAEPSPCERFGEALASAERLRGLTARQPVKCISASPAEFKAIVQKYLLTDTSPTKLALEEKALKLLGFVPLSFPYARCSMSSSDYNTSAFYQPEMKAVVVPSELSTPMEILVHEAVHALQDQHFNLLKLRQHSMKSGDSYLAFSAVAEGDATFIQSMFAHEEGVSVPEAVSPQAHLKDEGCTFPPLLEQSFDFPYDYGLVFIDSIQRATGYTAVNSLFTAPPSTTNSILYARRFLARDLPTHTTHINVTPQEKILYRDSLGEYVIRAMLKQVVGPQRGVLAAKGWAGDEAALIQSANDLSLRWEIDWESTKDALEFHSAYIKEIQRRFELTLNEAAHDTLAEASDHTRIHLQLKDQKVIIQISSPDITL